ncbi:MAG: LysR family transcriptional regulator [Pseudomonadota bacterium]
MDWDLIRSFLAVAEAGSLSGAARRTGQSQPTLGRHVKAAEAALGTELFVRVPEGLRLTEAGRSLIAPAREMAAQAAKLEALASGRDEALRGTVRITASVVVSHYILPQIIADLRRAEPEIEVELVPSDAAENLLFREADIAVRMFRPTQLDVIARHVGDQPLALYAATALLDRLGRPSTLEEVSALPFVGFDRSDMILRAMRGLGLEVDRHFFGVRCDDQAAFWRLVCAGCGVGAMQERIGAAEPLVERLDVDVDLPPLPVWLAAQEDVRRVPRVARVWAALVEGFG